MYEINLLKIVTNSFFLRVLFLFVLPVLLIGILYRFGIFYVESNPKRVKKYLLKHTFFRVLFNILEKKDIVIKPDIFECSGLKIDIKNFIVSYNQKSYEYPNNAEFKLLKLLVSKQDTVVTFNEIVKFIDFNSVSNKQQIYETKSKLINTLNENIGVPKDLLNELILNKTGVGYKLVCGE